MRVVTETQVRALSDTYFSLCYLVTRMQSDHGELLFHLIVRSLNILLSRYIEAVQGLYNVEKLLVKVYKVILLVKIFLIVGK